MELTPNQLAVLLVLRRYFYLRTAQIRDLVYCKDKDGSVTRECLRRLHGIGFVRRHEPRILEMGKMTAPPIFILTQKGSCTLAAQTGDTAHLLTVEPTFADWMSLNHYCALSSLHMTIDAAIATQARVKQHALYFEHEVINPNAQGGQKFRLQTTISQSPLVFCCPDSAFELEINGYRRVYYVEREMGSDTPGRVAAKKCKGYAGLHAAGLFRRHFPQARDFRVLAVCPKPGWRDLLRKEMKDKPGAELWTFATVEDITAEKFLTAPILYTMEQGPLPFAPGGSSAVALAGGGSAGGSAGEGCSCMLFTPTSLRRGAGTPPLRSAVPALFVPKDTSLRLGLSRRGDPPSVAAKRAGPTPGTASWLRLPGRTHALSVHRRKLPPHVFVRWAVLFSRCIMADETKSEGHAWSYIKGRGYSESSADGTTTGHGQTRSVGFTSAEHEHDTSSFRHYLEEEIAFFTRALNSVDDEGFTDGEGI